MYGNPSLTIIGSDSAQTCLPSLVLISNTGFTVWLPHCFVVFGITTDTDYYKLETSECSMVKVIMLYSR